MSTTILLDCDPGIDDALAIAFAAGHPGIDGSGMLQRADGNSVISGVGDTFRVSMRNAEMGDYEITNHVVEFQRNRRIGWEPVLSAASRAEDAADIGHRNGYQWIYELTPDGPDATIVTETYDCTRAPEWLRKAVRGGDRWVASMTARWRISTSSAPSGPAGPRTGGRGSSRPGGRACNSCRRSQWGTGRGPCCAPRALRSDRA